MASAAGGAGAWVYLIAFGSLVAFNAYMVLLAKTPASVASSYTFVNPVIAMLLGVVIANEVVTGFEWLACGVVLAGVILSLRGATLKRHQAKLASPSLVGQPTGP